MSCSKKYPDPSVKNLLLGIIAILASISLVFAEELQWDTSAPKTPPIKIYAEFDNFQVVPGTVVTLIIRGTLEHGWHIYSTQDQGEDAPQPTTISYQNSEHQKIGPLQETPPHIIEDKALNLRLAVHQNDFVLRQQFKISPLAAAGPQDFEANLNFQMCDNNICTPHQSQSFSTPLTIEK